MPGVKTNARIEDLLKHVGLEDRIIRSLDDVPTIKSPIDYCNVNKIMDDFKTASSQMLIEALNKEVEEG